MQTTVNATSIEAVCPSCKTHGLFSFAGIQYWSEKLVKAKGVAPSNVLRTCESCGSTFCEEDLNDIQE